MEAKTTHEGKLSSSAAEFLLRQLGQLAHLRDLRLALLGLQTSNSILEGIRVRVKAAALRDTVVVLRTVSGIAATY